MTPSAPSPALDPSRDAILEMGRATLELVASYLADLPSRPIFPATSGEELRARLEGDVPEEGTPFAGLLDVVRDVVLAGSRHNGHPRFFGYIASPATAATALADLVASALNANVTSWRSAPAPVELERRTVDWVRQVLGMPAGTEGLFVGGGSTANLAGLAAARDAKAPAQVSAEGVGAAGRPMRLYLSAEAHHSIVKAAGLLGLGRDNARVVPVDGSLRMDAGALAAMVAADRDAGALPFCVVATVGTTGTGAVDPIDAIADVAREHGLWLHVDASYGGFGMLAPALRPLFAGLHRADSVALDPHKWLYVPVDCGCILYTDPGRARAAFGHEAEYIRVLETEPREAYAFWDYGPELSRRFRALKVWMALAHAGTRALGEAIARDCENAALAARLVEASPDLELLSPVSLSIFCFRHLPEAVRRELHGAAPARRAELERELDAHNERLLAVLQRGGSSYLSNARVKGRFALRGCVTNFRTTAADMERLLEDVRLAATPR